MPKRCRKIVKAGNTEEVFTYTSGRIGLKIPVLPKMNETTEKQIKQNEKNATNKVRWYINGNFNQGDWWLTAEYPPNVRPSPEQVKTDIAKFTRNLRKIYQKEEKNFKYIFSVGIGKRGAAHLHIVLNYIEAEKIANAWRKIVGTKETPYPTMKFSPMDGRKNHADLAAYIIKNSCETYYDENRRVYGRRFCKSTNLIPPQIEVKIIHTKYIREPRDRKEYYVDRRYTYQGIDENGYPYQHYILVRVNSDDK